VKKIRLGVLLLALVLMVQSFGMVATAEEKKEQMMLTDVQLTKEQQAELAELTKEVIEKKKQVLNKYVEFGLMPQEKALKIQEKMDQHYTKLEQNGFIPHWGQCKKHHSHSH